MVLPINFEQLWKEELKNSSGVYSSRILDDEIETDFWHEFMGKKQYIFKMTGQNQYLKNFRNFFMKQG